MEIKISPAKENSFPLNGFLIKKTSVKEWILELQNLRIGLMEATIFPIPDAQPNSIWGCFVLLNRPVDRNVVGRNQLCQCVCPNFYIPEKSTVNLRISEGDQEKLFSKSIHVFHPDFNLVELTEQLIFDDLIVKPTEKSKFVIGPKLPPFIPKEIIRFQVMPVEEESALQKLEKDNFPKKEKLPDQPLNILEKGKLGLYKKIFKRQKNGGKDSVGNIEKTGFGHRFGSFMKLFSGKETDPTEKMQKDFEDLEKRNQKELDRLLNMLRDNPEEALKYAIPLDEQGANRGSNSGTFSLSKRWNSLSLFGSLFGNVGEGGGGSVDLGDGFGQLQARYNRTAEAFIEQKEYEKAAFVYMKLLKNFYKAAETLKNAGMYEAAAEIYLKHTNDKIKAAECYVEGNMYGKAIEIYEEKEDFLKVGDLYMKLKKPERAFQFYEKTADQLKVTKWYINAADIYRNKMNDDQRAQNTLMEGWDNGHQASDCLNQYFNHVLDDEERIQEIENVFAKKVNDQNRELFLKVLQKEFRKNNNINDEVRELGYKVIAQQVKLNPRIVEQLKVFNPNDKEITKDASRFRWSKRSR